MLNAWVGGGVDGSGLAVSLLSVVLYVLYPAFPPVRTIFAVFCDVNRLHWNIKSFPRI